MYLSTSTSTEDFPEMYLSTFQILYKLYLSTDVLKYKVLLPGSGSSGMMLCYAAVERCYVMQQWNDVMLCSSGMMLCYAAVE